MSYSFIVSPTSWAVGIIQNSYILIYVNWKGILTRSPNQMTTMREGLYLPNFLPYLPSYDASWSGLVIHISFCQSIRCFDSITTMWWEFPHQSIKWLTLTQRDGVNLSCSSKLKILLISQIFQGLESGSIRSATLIFTSSWLFGFGWSILSNVSGIHLSP